MIKVVLGFIQNKQGKFLLAKRHAKKAHGGLWEFPGGKIEDNESPSEAIIREIMEEFIADIEVKKIHEPYLHQDAYGHLEFVPILCGLESSTVTLTEHQEYKFLDVAEIQEYELAPADYKALAILSESKLKNI